MSSYFNRENIIYIFFITFQCRNNKFKKIRLKLKRNAFPLFGTSYESCIGGCDDVLNESLGIRSQNIRSSRDASDSGYGTNSSSRSASANTTRRPLEQNNQNYNSQSNQSNTTTQGNNQNWIDSRASSNNRTLQQQNNWNTVQPRNNRQPATPRQNSYDLSSLPSSSASNLANSAQSRSTNWNNTRMNQTPSAQGSNTSYNCANDSRSNDVMCNCNEPTRELVVQRETANKGNNYFIYKRIKNFFFFFEL